MRTPDARAWSSPLVVAPMAGGPTTPELVAAASSSGAFAFIDGGYRTAADLDSTIRQTARQISAGFGVNVFVPGRPSLDRRAVDRYLAGLASEAERFAIELGAPRWDDDAWDAKLEVLVDSAPMVASFTFGCPPDAVVEALHARGTLVMVTVTSVDEAAAGVHAGADLLCAQGFEAGGHRSTFDDTAADREQTTLELVRAIKHQSDTPVVAAGGIATPSDLRAAIDAGAVAAQAGTAFLCAHEAGTSPLHRAALGDAAFGTTAMTRAFTGRRARGLVNGFMRHHTDAPSAFPEIHNATRPLRAAAARAGDAHTINLWAGTGHRHARTGSTAGIVDWLLSELPS